MSTGIGCRRRWHHRFPLRQATEFLEGMGNPQLQDIPNLSIWGPRIKKLLANLLHHQEKERFSDDSSQFR
jgi:hypothetical protein